MRKRIQDHSTTVSPRGEAGAAIASKPLYGTSTTRRTRRTRGDIAALEDAIVEICEERHPLSVRHLFYVLVSRKLIEKSEKEYRNVACRLALRLRRQDRVPYNYIVDGTRWTIKNRVFSGLEAALRNTARTYRRDLWESADAYVEVWCEKDSIASILNEVTSEFDVPLLATRGFSSDSFLFATSETIEAIGKPAFIYFFADYDPSGVLNPKTCEKKLRAFGADVTFEIVAVTPEQIRDLDLPTRPTKRKGNPHAKGFDGDSVDLDAMSPATLQGIVRNCIERHVDQWQLDQLRKTEAAERETLNCLSSNWGVIREVVRTYELEKKRGRKGGGR